MESVIADYDLHDEDGNELTDDLYVIRSEQLDELGLTVARRIHKAIRELEAQGKTGFPVHSMAFGSMPVTIAKDATAPTRCASTIRTRRWPLHGSAEPRWRTLGNRSTSF